MGSKLQDNLIKKFGGEVYLTNSMLDWSDVITFDPQAEYDPALSAQFGNAANPIDVDGILDERKFNFGQGGRSLWTADGSDLEFDDEYDGIFLFGVIIKEAGERTFNVPRVLAPLIPEIQRQAEHHFAHSEHAVDKLAGLSLRRLPLLKGQKQLSEGHWHVHNPFTRELVERGYHMFDLTERQLQAIEQVSPNLVQSEYLVSNICPSLIQTEASKDPMTNKGHINFRILSGAPEHRQADDLEVVMGNSYMYHTAATVKPEQVGQVRTFAITSYIPTTDMEQHFENG